MLGRVAVPLGWHMGQGFVHYYGSDKMLGRGLFIDGCGIMGVMGDTGSRPFRTREREWKGGKDWAHVRKAEVGRRCGREGHRARGTGVAALALMTMAGLAGGG